MTNPITDLAARFEAKREECDWAAELAYSMLRAHGVTPELQDAVATELRRIEATGYTRGYEACRKAVAPQARDMARADAAGGAGQKEELSETPEAWMVTRHYYDRPSTVTVLSYEPEKAEHPFRWDIVPLYRKVSAAPPPPAQQGSSSPLSQGDWLPMKDAPTGVPIIARHKPNDRMPDGWVATIKLGHKDEEEEGCYDTILHYNGDASFRGFRGVWTGWLPIGSAIPSPLSRPRDFELMLARIIHRHSKGLDITGTLAGAKDLLARKGSLSPLREEATAPQPAGAERVDLAEDDLAKRIAHVLYTHNAYIEALWQPDPTAPYEGAVAWSDKYALALAKGIIAKAIVPASLATARDGGTGAGDRAAIEFAITIDDHYDRLDFLRGWIEGDVSEWPEFAALATLSATDRDGEARNGR